VLINSGLNLEVLALKLNSFSIRPWLPPFFRPGSTISTLLVAMLLGAGCATPRPTALPPDSVPYSELRLREGDMIKIAFPGAPNLDTTQQVRRDGKITLSLGGEVLALGKTPSELEKELLNTYESQLTVKQVVVTVNSSTYPVFVTGAVLRPGKLQADRPLSVLEAIMESGGFDYARANLKGVTVLRQHEGQTLSYKLNLKDTLKGGTTRQFYLKPSDIVYVPEKFSWF
jgi:polysaccharide export outer membrane protein